MAMNKRLNLLGLAQVAGGLISGESSVIEAVQNGKARHVIAATDLSERSLKAIKNKCDFYQVPLSLEFTQAEISQALGKKRSVCAFTNQGFAKKFN